MPGRQHRVDAALLQHDAHEFGQLTVIGNGIEPQHRDAATSRAAVSLHRLDGRRLARPIGPENDQDLSGFGRQVQPVHRSDLTLGAVAHGEVRHFDGGHVSGWHVVAGYFEQA